MRRTPPHLPFLTGPPDFTVGLRPIDPQDWLLPDWEADCLPEKRALIAQQREAVFRCTQGAQPLCTEAADSVGAHLHIAAGGDLVAAAVAVSDDLVVMAPAPDGGYRAVAAVLCAPTYFSAQEAIGKDLFGLHAPVPDRLADGAPGLGRRIGRVFSGLQPNQVLERFNWTLQPGPARYTPSSGPLMAIADTADAADALALLHLRVERQTIRKLPQTGAVLFTIRISLDPLSAVFAVDGAKAALVSAWANAPAYVRSYKRWPRMERLMRAAVATAF
jgi:dimethylamine monooxygenase subunit A